MSYSTDVRIVDRIACKGDSGRTYTVVIRQKFRTMVDLSGDRHEVPGTKDAMTSDGQHVNYLDDGRYQIVLTDEILTPV